MIKNEDCKYKFTNETRIVNGHTLHRIVALRDIPENNVFAGGIGGFIESEDNLKQEGGCWVGHTACVYEGAVVFDDAYVEDSALVFGDASIGDRTAIYGHAKVYGDAQIRGHSSVTGNAVVCGAARIEGYARIGEKALVSGNAVICGDATIIGEAVVDGRVEISDFSGIRGKAKVSGEVRIRDTVQIHGDAFVSGRFLLQGRTRVGAQGNIKQETDILTIGPIGSRHDYTTFYRTSFGPIWVSCGCFNGDIEAFERAVGAEHGKTHYGCQYFDAINLARTTFYIKDESPNI